MIFKILSGAERPGPLPTPDVLPMGGSVAFVVVPRSGCLGISGAGCEKDGLAEAASKAMDSMAALRRQRFIGRSMMVWRR
jgi:hypothetical protein